MKQDSGQIASSHEDGTRQAELSAVRGRGRPSLPAVKAGKPAQSRPQPRRLGARAAGSPSHEEARNQSGLPCCMAKRRTKVSSATVLRALRNTPPLF